MRSASGSSTSRASASSSPVNGRWGGVVALIASRVQDDRPPAGGTSAPNTCSNDRAIMRASPTRARSSTVITMCSRRTRVDPPTIAAPHGMVERPNDGGPTARDTSAGRPPERNPHVTSRPPTTAMLGRRAQAQRRLRRAAGRRLFCSTNGCTTYLVPDADGRPATCPICGLQSKPPAGLRRPGRSAGPRRRGRPRGLTGIERRLRDRRAGASPAGRPPVPPCGR